MKTAGEWNWEHTKICHNDPSVHGQLLPTPKMVEFIEAIQLDAERAGYERGVREAAGIVSSYHHAITTPQTRALFHKTIITALLANPKEPNAKI